MKAIKEAEHFLYIENQFFLSQASEEDNPKNRVAAVIASRIRRAILERKPFKVYVMIPVIPGSKISGPDGLMTRILSVWEYASTFRGSHSLVEVLKRENPGANIDDYIQFFSLRTHAFQQGSRTMPKASSSAFEGSDADANEAARPFTEQIYIHAKSMIVDDRIAFIMSANLNDRSLAGNRDSEIAVRIEDSETVDIKMAGEDFKASRFVHDYRCHLWCEHLRLPKRFFLPSSSPNSIFFLSS